MSHKGRDQDHKVLRDRIKTHVLSTYYLFMTNPLNIKIHSEKVRLIESQAHNDSTVIKHYLKKILEYQERETTKGTEKSKSKNLERPHISSCFFLIPTHAHDSIHLPFQAPELVLFSRPVTCKSCVLLP